MKIPSGPAPDGPPVPGTATVQQLARQLVNESREYLPVADVDGKPIGAMNRQEALDILLGTA